VNSALLHRRRSRSIVWIAFVSSLAIHIGAVALAKTKSTTAALEHFTPFGDVDIHYAAEPEPALPEKSPVPLPLEEVHPDQDVFPEEDFTRPPVRGHQKSQPASLVRGTTTVSLRSVKAMIAYAPRPIYPYQARRQRVTGSGIALLSVDQASGTVTDVHMIQSCGNAMLDNSTLDALRRWRFKRET
jgi:TonB family protein